MRPSFQWGVHCEFHIEGYKRAILSVPALFAAARFHEKDLLSQRAQIEGKATLAEHLRFLSDRNIIGGSTPLLAIGVRNNLVNLRAPIMWNGRAYAVEGERPEESLRPYYGIGCRAGKLRIGQALGGTPEVWQDFFISGIPVLWDNVDDETLLNLILVEAADHSHVFRLPRGRHPHATDATRQAWLQLHNIFAANLHSDFATAVAAMRRAVATIEPPLSRCDDYLHAVVGIREDGTIVCIYAHGRLEALGRRAKTLGCRRAVCIENSGSVMPTYFPKGCNGEQIPILRAPNFGPYGRALLVFELENSVFSSFPVLQQGRP